MLGQIAVLGSIFGLFVQVSLAAQAAPLRLELVPNDDAPERPDIRLVTPRDGDLLLLHVSGGNARVMFPGKPTESPALAGGVYNLDRLGASLPAAYGRGGRIVAAWSDAPIHTREFVRYGHWAISDLNRSAFLANPVAATVALANRLGANPVATAVEYGWVGEATYQEEMANRGFRMDGEGGLDWKVYQNLFRIIGRCGSGTRDVTGAREYCSALSPPPRSTLVPVTTLLRPAPANPPTLPQYTPPPASGRTPAATPRPSTPASGGTRKPL